VGKTWHGRRLGGRPRVRWEFGKRRTSELEEVIIVAEDTPVPETPIELELGDLDRVEIRREWL